MMYGKMKPMKKKNGMKKKNVDKKIKVFLNYQKQFKEK